jgi:hypothetical protein
VEVVAVIALRLSSALSLAAFVSLVPGIASGQNPAPSPKTDIVTHREVVAGPVERRMLVRGVADRDIMFRGMMPDAASMFLGSAGQLQLSDSQVTRLAAIARRAASRRETMRAHMDSAMTAVRSRAGMEMSREGSGDGAAMMMMPMPASSAAQRAAQHDDDRDAFAVLTPDQLATAWELMAAHHPMGGM